MKNISIGEVIRIERLKRGLSQSELAAMCGWSEKKYVNNRAYDNGQHLISNYEKGRYKPSIDRIIIMAKAFKIPVGRLLSKLN